MKSWRPLIVGELNPYGTDLRFAMYPKPEHSAGGNLCHRVLGFKYGKTYLDLFDRTNLCIGKWDDEAALHSAVRIQDDHHFQLILLGRKVAKAFRLGDCPPYSVVYNWGREIFANHWIVLLPHPSGLCREWNEPGAYERARELVKAVYPYDLFCRRDDLVEVRKVERDRLDEGLLVRPLLQEPVPDADVDGSGEADGRAD